jgi:hypothetical protein
MTMKLNGWLIYDGQIQVRFICYLLVEEPNQVSNFKAKFKIKST